MFLQSRNISYKHLLARWLIVLLLAMTCTRMEAWDLTDKNAALLGDSNTWIGGDDCTKPQGWNYWFANLSKPLTIKSYARSGATWTHTRSTQPNVEQYSEVLGDDNVIFNQILRLYADVDINGAPVPDVIVISAGTNDAWFADKRPEEFSVTADQAFGREDWEYGAALPSAFRSLPESMIYDLRMLNGFFPQAKIVVVTPPPSIKISPEMLSKVSDIINDVGQRLGAHVIRMDQLSPIIPDNEIVNKRFTSDGTHTSGEGARRHGEIISRAIADMKSPISPPSE